MATVGGFSRHHHLDELNEPLETSSGWMTPAQRKAAARANLDITGNVTGYDNATSGLAATNVQDAIDEIDARVDDLDAAAGVQLQVYAADAVPTAAGNTGRLIVVSNDDTQGFTLAVSNGTNWLVVTILATLDDGS